jgi:hypothetical protein
MAERCRWRRVTAGQAALANPVPQRSAVTASGAWRKDDRRMDAMDSLVGKKAPPFSMDTTAGRQSLDDYRGRTLVLAFFPLAFTGG